MKKPPAVYVKLPLGAETVSELRDVVDLCYAFADALATAYGAAQKLHGKADGVAKAIRRRRRRPKK